MIIGYKAFHKGLINCFNQKLKVGKIYHANGDIIFNKNGFHMCTDLLGCLKYFDALTEDIDIAKVICYGNIHKYDDSFYDYENMYSCEYMIIDRVLTRKEIINYALNLDMESFIRFISLFRLTKEELIFFKKRFQKIERVLDYIKYYQENDKEVFNRKLEK